jgi:hypothetical protein
MGLIGNIKKFSFAEMTSNPDGKTSATSTTGAFIIFIGGICFLLGCIDKMFIGNSVDIITQAVMFTGLGAGLLGVKNFTGAKIKAAEAAAGTDKPADEGPCAVCAKEPCECEPI